MCGIFWCDSVGSRYAFIYLCIWDTSCVLNLGVNDLLTNEEKTIIWSNVASPLSPFILRLLDFVFLSAVSLSFSVMFPIDSS